MPRRSNRSRGVRTAKRLAILINELGGGGAERVAITLANHLQAQGYEIHLVTLDGGPVAYPLSPGVIVHQLPTARLAWGPLKVLTLPLAAFAFARYVRRARLDAAMSFLVRANLAMILSGWSGNRLRKVISERVVSVTYAGRSPTSLVMRSLVRMLYPRTDAAIAISNGVKDSLVAIGVGADRVRVIYNPQDIAGIRRAASSETAPERRGFEIVTIARLTPQKDIPTLLRAFRLVLDAEPSARLSVLGEGPDLEALRRLARELGVAAATSWRGWVRPYGELARSDVFVLSSVYEGFANVIVEAMACGVPVVSTDCPSGPREILAGGEYGLLVPVGDSRALGEAILRLRNDASLRVRLRTRALRRADDFDVARIAGSYLDVLGVS
jgi:glycosyltransferase involved in cell wall biosynthesis